VPEAAAAVTVRDEAPEDRAAVARVVTDAFGRTDEARLVAALRVQADTCLSLVAERAGVVVGHVLFSPVAVAGADDAPALGALAPLSVTPSLQRAGIGSELTRAGLARCPEHGWRAVFLLGDPGYYTRFGFQLAAARGLHYVSEAFDAGFQVLELETGALDGVRGLVQYHPAFAGL
jgi:putative acetyltransferase